MSSEWKIDATPTVRHLNSLCKHPDSEFGPNFKYQKMLCLSSKNSLVCVSNVRLVSVISILSLICS